MVLYVGTIIQLALGVVTSVVIARTLKPEQYGNYSFVFTVINFILLSISTGHFVSISMILAQSKDENNRRCFLGASLLISLLVSFIFSSIVFGYSFFNDYIFHDKLGYSLRLLAIPLIFFPIQTYLESVLMGLSRITSLTVLRVLPKLLYFIVLLLYIQMANIDFFMAVVLMLFTSYVVYIGQIIILKPDFTNLFSNLKYIEAENKKYGFHVYLGSMANVATAYLCTLSIGYFSNNIQLGFFNLALTISTPLSLLPNVIATAFYNSFADMERIPDKLIRYTIALCVVSYAVFFICLKKVLIFLYSTDYEESVIIAYVLGLGMIIHGFGDVFNRFLCVKARGKDVRNAAFIVGGVNVLAILLLVPIFSGTGAAITRLLAGIAYFMAMYLYYKKSNLFADIK